MFHQENHMADHEIVNKRIKKKPTQNRKQHCNITTLKHNLTERNDDIIRERIHVLLLQILLSNDTDVKY